MREAGETIPMSREIVSPKLSCLQGLPGIQIRLMRRHGQGFVMDISVPHGVGK